MVFQIIGEDFSGAMGDAVRLFSNRIRLPHWPKEAHFSLMPTPCKVGRCRRRATYFHASRKFAKAASISSLLAIFAAGHVAERLVDSPKLFGSRVIYADAVRATKLGQVLLILLARH